MNAKKPLGSKDDPSYVRVTNMPDPNLAYSSVAHPGAKGFIYNGTMKPSVADKYKGEGYSFCMRNLNTQDNEWDVALTAQETDRITGTSDKHGYALALMPMFILNVSSINNTNNNPLDIANNVLDLLNSASIPIGTTVWLQLKDNDNGAKSDQIQEIEHYIFQSGYSVGILGDEVQLQQQTNGRVLESTYTPFEESNSGTTIRTIMIGENSGTYPIYWALQ